MCFYSSLRTLLQKSPWRILHRPRAIFESSVSKSPVAVPVIECEVNSVSSLGLFKFICPGHCLSWSVRASRNFTAEIQSPDSKIAE